MLALSFLTRTLMFPLLPMVTLKHTIFHIESCFRNVWRALRHGAQAVTDRHNAALKAAVFSQQGHFCTAWLQWVCVASGGEMDNLNRRSSPLLMRHACTKNHRQLYGCFFGLSGMKIVLSRWQCKPRPFVPKAQLHGGKRQLLPGASGKAVKSRVTWVGPPSSQRSSLMTGPHVWDTRLESGFLPDICLSSTGCVWNVVDVYLHNSLQLSKSCVPFTLTGPTCVAVLTKVVN